MFRFWWLIGSAHIRFAGTSAFWLDHIEAMTMIGVMVELTRRMVWAVIRVENEFFNNFEQYRDILAIPPIRNEKEFE